MTVFRYKAIRVRQADHDIFSFAAPAIDILNFSEIERVGRNDEGHLKGFQRHQIASHIREIRDYLSREDALLPNAVILAFIDGITWTDEGGDVVDIEIHTTNEKPGFVVDGQQRLTALSGIDKPNFRIFVSALVCRDYNELRQQFVLINNTRPLPKTLVYELLPTVEGLPDRLTARKFAARLVDQLNFDKTSALFGEIRQHTNPTGVLSDTALQKFIMNSASDGAIRELVHHQDYTDRAYSLVNEYFWAVRAVFGNEWTGMNTRVSRLKHGAGIISMGFVMDLLYSTHGATTRVQFEPGLRMLQPYTAWTTGQWHFDANDIRPWNGIQNTPSDIDLLTRFLVGSLKRALRAPLRIAQA